MLYAGETVLIKAIVRLDDALTDPDSMTVEVYKNSKTGVVVQSEASMSGEDGMYTYAWNSDGEVAAVYWAKIKAVKDALPNWEWVKIILND